MLRELFIRDFAIIDDLRISFSGGLTILSGETGAGKSVIIQAVNLVLGSRASVAMIRSGAEHADLEALFDISLNSPVAGTMRRQGLKPSDGLIIRRRLSRNKGGRIYINARMATKHQLVEVTENLASISGQHAHQSLLKEEQHLMLLDQFAELGQLRHEVSSGYRALLPLLKELANLRAKNNRRNERRQLLEFQKQEIENADIAVGEDEKLQQERTRLKNAETLIAVAHSAIEHLYGAQGAVAERLGEIRKDLEKSARSDPGFSSVTKQIEGVGYQIEEITAELRSYVKTLDLDEARLDTVEARLDELHRMKRKYGDTLEAVISHLRKCENELCEIETMDERIAGVEAEIESRRKTLASAARTLSRQRSRAGVEMARQIEAQLETLKMGHTKFRIELTPIAAEAAADPLFCTQSSAITDSGCDRARFLIAPNIGETQKPLSGIASGGELSRAVLAIKAIQADSDALETIVFDEVDAGIGGSVAETVGRKLAELSRRHQIICITHLPQIAKFGSHHYRISKQVEKGRTRTLFEPLEDEERIQEIARMLGGADITPTTMKHAREMLETAK